MVREATLNTTEIQNQKTDAVRTLAWIGATIFSALVYGCVMGAITQDHFLQVLALSFLFFAVGFLFGPLAFVFCVLALGSQLKEWIEIVFRWIDCCPGAGSDGWVGLMIMGSAFVGAGYSTYLLAQYFRRHAPQVWHVLAGSILLAATWMLVIWNASETCGAHGCPVK